MFSSPSPREISTFLGPQNMLFPEDTDNSRLTTLNASSRGLQVLVFSSIVNSKYSELQ